jgi:hypothetical protein
MAMGLRPEPCKGSRGDHVLLRFLKNKLHKASARCGEAEVEDNSVALNASFTPACIVLPSSSRAHIHLSSYFVFIVSYFHL